MRALGGSVPFRASTRVLAFLATAAALLSLAAWAPTGPQSEQAMPPPAPPRAIDVIENLAYGSATGGAVDVCLPPSPVMDPDVATPRAAIISIHGGSWRSGDKANSEWRSVCQWLASEGFVTFSVGYRLAPQHPFPAAIEDVRAAVRYMRSSAVTVRFNIDPTRIGAFGGSAGGNLAALLGVEGTGILTTGSRVTAVAELSGPTNLTADGIESPEFAPLVLSYLGCASFATCPGAVRASPLFQVDASDPPFFVGHSLDERIPLAQSTEFVSALRQRGVDTTLVTVPGRLHSIALLSDDMRSRIAGFFHAKLDGPLGR